MPLNIHVNKQLIIGYRSTKCYCVWDHSHTKTRGTNLIESSVK